MQEIDKIQGLTSPKHGGVILATWAIIFAFIAILVVGMTKPEVDATASAPVASKTR